MLQKLFTTAAIFSPIDQKDWQDLKKKKKKATQKGRLFKGMQWTNVVATGIKSVHPFCSFGFKRHTINTSQSRSKTAVFSCKAYCHFKDCPVTVKVQVKDEKTLKADVRHKTCAWTVQRCNNGKT